MPSPPPSVIIPTIAVPQYSAGGRPIKEQFPLAGIDTRFITNQAGQHLVDRFRVLIKDTRFFDVLVGYFYTSGFYALCQPLEAAEKIRILIGIKTNRQTLDLIEESRSPVQMALQFSHSEAKESFSDSVTQEMEASEDNVYVERGVACFLEWLQSGKLEIKAYPSEKIHAKLYIMTFVEGDKDVGRVITGSSNFTQAGLMDNLEFNVELKDKSDYLYAKAKFEELWLDAVDVKEKYIETIQRRTWLNNTITPYELYLKFLYEYFKDKINTDQESIDKKYLPEGFLDLEYQTEAVKDARAKLDEYGGVFIADVVGLGKTYISAMLASQLDGRNLVIAPPGLLDEDNPGSWPSVFRDFGVRATRFQSIGQLDDLVEQGVDRYKNVFIDEAHRFRSEMNVTYEKLAQVCRGKRVILVSATPLNNSPRDILSQVKLFQKSRKSTIPNLPNLERFFGNLGKRLEDLDRQKDYDKYMDTVGDNAREVREKVLKYIMVRRTRSEINKYFSKDLKRQGLKFPEVADPEPILYQLDPVEDSAFTQTVALVSNDFTYSRYTPMLYYEGEKITQPEELAQKNMRKFMRILLVKRLESSFFAFRQTVARFIASYERFLDEFDKGNVYVSKKYANKLFEFLENDDDEAIQRLIDDDKAKWYDAADFKPEFHRLLKTDLQVLKRISELWTQVKRDPKLQTFIDVLKERDILKRNKLIIFTESRETADYLSGCLETVYPGKVLSFSGVSGSAARDKVTANFDARARKPLDQYRILVTTEVLSEGVNLHRSNVVINYDIPWNPARLMQRVGRVNRVDTKFDTIHTFNFFPTVQSNDEIKLKEAAEYKIQAFIEMLGADARLLMEGEEIKSHDLFSRLTSKKAITGEDGAEESELKYLRVIQEVRDTNPDLFERIKQLPRKARTARAIDEQTSALLTYFRKGRLQKFYQAGGGAPKELDFFVAAGRLEAAPDTPRESMGPDYYDLLEKNKEAFRTATTEEPLEIPSKGGRDSATFVLKVLKSNQVRHFKGFTEDDEFYIRDVARLIEEGALPGNTVKGLSQGLAQALGKEINPLKVLAILKMNIASEFFKETAAESAAQTSGPREVILSEYFAGGTN